MVRTSNWNCCLSFSCNASRSAKTLSPWNFHWCVVKYSKHSTDFASLSCTLIILKDFKSFSDDLKNWTRSKLTLVSCLPRVLIYQGCKRVCSEPESNELCLLLYFVSICLSGTKTLPLQKATHWHSIQFKWNVIEFYLTDEFSSFLLLVTPIVPKLSASLHLYNNCKLSCQQVSLLPFSKLPPPSD